MDESGTNNDLVPLYSTETGELVGYLTRSGLMPECPEQDNDFCVAGLEDLYSDCDEVTYRMANEVEVVPICMRCGRNASVTWWKCCPVHATEQGLDVLCQTCVEFLHPGDPEFMGERG